MAVDEKTGLTPGERDSLYKKTLRWQDVQPNTLNLYKRMKGARVAMKRIHGEGPFTDQQWAEYAVERAKIKKALAKGKGPVREKKPTTPSEADLQARLTRYTAEYNVNTPNDIASLRQMVALEMAMEDAQDGIRILMRKLRKGEDVSVGEIERMTSSSTKLSQEHRQLQNMLGIDRSTRAQQDKERGGEDYMRQLTTQANDLMASKAVKISCPSCVESGTVLNMGFILSHFAGWKFEGVCPKCGRPITLDSSLAKRL